MVYNKSEKTSAQKVICCMKTKNKSVQVMVHSFINTISFLTLSVFFIYEE